MVFGQQLRQSLAAQSDEFDRVKLIKPVEVPMMEATRPILRNLMR